METIEFLLSRPHVELCQLLKLTGIADSGGGGKRIVAAGGVRVDGQPESRKTAKIRAGQSVRYREVTILVKAPSV
jgi:ribosome-associated protein